MNQQSSAIQYRIKQHIVSLVYKHRLNQQKVGCDYTDSIAYIQSFIYVRLHSSLQRPSTHIEAE